VQLLDAVNFGGDIPGLQARDLRDFRGGLTFEKQAHTVAMVGVGLQVEPVLIVGSQSMPLLT
jgi:hypothetical protein